MGLQIPQKRRGRPRTVRRIEFFEVSVPLVPLPSRPSAARERLVAHRVMITHSEASQTRHLLMPRAARWQSDGADGAWHAGRTELTMLSSQMVLRRACALHVASAHTHTAQHSTAHQHTPPHHTCIRSPTAPQHRTYTTSQHSRARRHSIGRHGARGAPAALGAVLPRAPNVPRHGQQDMKERTKGGPRLSSFIFGPLSSLSELSDAPRNNDRPRHELARTRHSPPSQRG